MSTPDNVVDIQTEKTKQKNTIHRVKKCSENPYFPLLRGAAQDKRLSWKAKGILSYMLSLPDDWDFYRGEMATHAPDGIDSLRSGMEELKKYGYITTEKVRDSKGRVVGWVTTVDERVAPPPDYSPSTIGKSKSGKPELGKPELGKSDTTNTQITNTHITNNTQQQEAVVDNELEFLLKYGFSEGDAKALVDKHGLPNVKQAATMCDEDNSVKYPKSWIEAGLNDGWARSTAARESPKPREKYYPPYFESPPEKPREPLTPEQEEKRKAMVEEGIMACKEATKVFKATMKGGRKLPGAWDGLERHQKIAIAHELSQGNQKEADELLKKFRAEQPQYVAPFISWEEVKNGDNPVDNEYKGK